MARIRALLIDDHAIFRQSVALALRVQAHCDVMECATIRQALEILEQRAVDVVLLDHDLGSERASQFLPAAHEIGYRGKVLIVTAWISDTEARRLLRQGVSGIFLKEDPLGMLAEGIRAVLRGEVWLHHRYATLSPQVDPASEPALRPVFNERQRKVLHLVVEGLSNKEIGERLNISESYVKALLQGLFHAIGVRTRGQLVRVALEHYEDQL